MNQVKSEEKCQMCTPVCQVCPVQVYQQTSHSLINFRLRWRQTAPSLPMTSTPEPLTATSQHYPEVMDYMHQFYMARGTAGDLTACQLRNPSSSLPQGVAGVSTHSSPKPMEDAIQKRELRLMKNREAARECRRKKKEYVRCLENRVAVLENQNKTLIEELRSLKGIYGNKAE